MKGHKVILASILLMTVVFPRAQSQKMSSGQSLNRKRALAMLKGCSRSLSSEGCNEDTAEYLIGLYNRGDRALLSSLLDAGLVSDGALSESLGSFYGELLLKEPLAFLKALKFRPQNEQHRLAWLAATMDGSGMPKEMLREVKSKLTKIAGQKHNRLSPVARLCVSELNKVRAG